MRVISIILCALFPTISAANPQFCETLQVTAPKTMGNFTRVKTADYETLQAGAGYGVLYSGPNASLSAFYFDGRQRSFDIEAQLAVLRQALDELQKIIERDGAQVSGSKAEQLHMNALTFLAQATDSKDNTHFVAIGARGECFLKIRFTARPGFDDPKGTFNRMLRDYDATLR